MTTPAAVDAEPGTVPDRPTGSVTGPDAIRAIPGLARASGADRLAALALAVAALTAGLAAFGVPPSSPQDDGPVLVAAGPPPSASSGAFLRTPPFDPLRRPIVGMDLLPVGPSPLALPAAASVAVAGVLSGPGAARVLFRGEVAWQGLGSDYLGWRVEAIGPDAVTLGQGGVSQVLRTRDALRP